MLKLSAGLGSMHDLLALSLSHAHIGYSEGCAGAVKRILSKIDGMFSSIFYAYNQYSETHIIFLSPVVLFSV